MAASSLNLKHLPRLLHTISLCPMAASSFNLKHLPRLLHTSSRRPMTASSLNLKHLFRLLHTSSIRPMSLLMRTSGSSSFATDAEKMYYETIHVVREPEPEPGSPPFVHHEFLVRCLEDGFNIRLYMAGVNKDSVKVWIEGGELIAEGKKEKDFEDEDDVLIRYRITRPPTEVFNLDAIWAEINNGILKVCVPRKE